MNEVFVEKFGGASVNSSEAIKNVASIILSQNKKRLIVISAMGKTTNHLERVLNCFVENKFIDKSSIEESKNYHKDIINNLFPDEDEDLNKFLGIKYKEIENKLLDNNIDKDYDKLYDSIVSFGEVIGTTIISKYFDSIGLAHKFVLANDIIKTDSSFRRAKVLWKETEDTILNKIEPLFNSTDTIITQGFIGSNQNNEITTLGREGSDFSAAVFAYCLNANSVTIWSAHSYS